MGAVTVTAFATMFLPVEWMAATHRWLGLGELPRAPVVDYLARSIAALYGFHGVLLLLVARDPVRYKPIVTYIAALNVIFGAALIGIDVHAGMPAWWTFGEGPPIIAFGVVVAYLNSTAARQPARYECAIR